MGTCLFRGRYIVTGLHDTVFNQFKIYKFIVILYSFINAARIGTTSLGIEVQGSEVFSFKNE
jgi:hypothetical protein